VPAITSPPDAPPADARHSPGLPVSHAHRRLRVLFVQHCANRTGSTISGKLVVEGFLRAGWTMDVAFGFDGPMIAEYERLGCRTHVVPHKNWLRGRSFLHSLQQMNAERRNARPFQKLIREVRPDVVYVNSLVSLAGAIAARRERVPSVWHIRELFDDVGGEMHVPGFGGRALVRRMLNGLATRRIAISKAVARNILGTTDPSQVDLVPNAVGQEFFDLAASADECRRGFDLPPGVPVIGVPGTLRPMKGHPFFLKAAARIAASFPSCVFAITGTGEPEYTAALHREVHDLGLTGHVRFLGTVSDMPRFYRACDLVCVPSASEPFGRTVIEAFATGTPIVATAVGGIQETIEDNVTGLLVAFGDSESLSCAIGKVLGNPQLAAALRDGGRRAAASAFRAQLCQERLIEVVRSACPAAGGVRGASLMSTFAATTSKE